MSFCSEEPNVVPSVSSSLDQLEDPGKTIIGDETLAHFVGKETGTCEEVKLVLDDKIRVRLTNHQDLFQLY